MITPHVYLTGGNHFYFRSLHAPSLRSVTKVSAVLLILATMAKLLYVTLGRSESSGGGLDFILGTSLWRK